MRAPLEARFHHEFSKVRVHRDGDAARRAGELGARAMTRGRHIAFAPGEYAPQSSEGRRLLAHELTHVVQQETGSGRSSTGDPAVLEREAHRAAGAAARGIPAAVRQTAARGALQMERRTIGGREFEVGDVRLNDRARTDVTAEGALVDLEDQAHVAVTGDDLLGYEVDYTNPRDPFRWQKVRDVVDEGHVDVMGVDETDPVVDSIEVADGAETARTRSLDDLGGAGVTLLTRARFMAIHPGETSFVLSPDADRDKAYYASSATRPGRSELGANALAHELLGHYWLALQGVPFSHPESLQEALPAVERGERTLTPDQLREIAERYERMGMLRAEHGITDPFGETYVGSVRDFLEHYVSSRARVGADQVLVSPTVGVGPALLEQVEAAVLDSLASGDFAAAGSGGRFTFSDDFGLKWELLSQNYEVLRFAEGHRAASEVVPTRTADGLLEALTEAVSALPSERRSALLVFLELVSTDTSRRRQLAVELRLRLH